MNETTPNKPSDDQPEEKSPTPVDTGSTLDAGVKPAAGPDKTAPGPSADEVEAPPAPESPVTDTAQRSGGGRGLSLLALLLALLAAVASAYVFWNQRQVSLGAESSRSDLDAAIGRLDDSARQLSASLAELEGDAGQLQSDQSAAADTLQRQRARIDGLESGLSRLARSRETVGSQLAREEMEQLLRIANYQLNLAHDPDTALAALQAADAVLARLADPGLQPLRSQLSDDILALSSVERVDIEGIALRLDSLARRVDQLPLNADAAELLVQGEEPPASGGWARFRQKVSEFLAGIFAVRRTESSQGPLLSREEAFFLRRNLELELQAARVALLARDEDVFNASLGAARRWTLEYFDRDATAVETFVDGLGAIADQRLGTEYPDISGSLRIYRELAEQQTEET